MNKMVVFPIILFIILSVFVIIYEGAVPSGFGHGELSGDPLRRGTDVAWYDSGGRPIAWYNMSILANVTESGEIVDRDSLSGYYGFHDDYGQLMIDVDFFWCNNTNPSYDSPYNILHIDPEYLNAYPLYNNPDAELRTAGETIFGFFVNGEIGFLGILIIMAVIAGIVGLHVLSSGESDSAVNMIVKIGVYLGFFGVVAVLPFAFLLEIPFGNVFFYVVTGVYTLGVLGSL